MLRIMDDGRGAAGLREGTITRVACSAQLFAHGNLLGAHGCLHPRGQPAVGVTA